LGKLRTVNGIALVPDHLMHGKAFNKRLRLGDVVHLTARELPAQRVAQRIRRRMNLGAQPPTRAPERLRAVFFGRPPHANAPARWCYR
jgi:hypothetical protein